MLKVAKKLRDRLDKIGAPEKPEVTPGVAIFDVRDEEQDYARLQDKEVKEANRYGQRIDLIELSDDTLPRYRPMMINENPKVGTNPNRNKQHGFHFTADNCIGCHACEAACSEKNDNPAHISFRNVGYVESGSYPDYRRMNISMACNHCDDPVCLKGCPTRAYTKHAEYGAVLQDPETCFGCGYCTWVCPYNAPQLDPVQGRVSKCNMCVDRLEEGLKPACVSACLGNALNFGVIENTPENREQCKTEIPGFPSPEITHPNIRFQQTNSTQNEMTRTDSMPLKYHKQEDGTFRSVVDEKAGKDAAWNLKRLSSRENPLVLFTLLTQGAMGAFTLLFFAKAFAVSSLAGLFNSVTELALLVLLLVMQAGGLLLSTMHLGKPWRFYRGFNNLRYSPVSREAFGVALFFTFMAAYSACTALGLWVDLDVIGWLGQAFGSLAVISAACGLYFMYRSYRIKARPFWDHWQTACSFAGSALTIGPMVVTLVALLGNISLYPLLSLLTPLVILGLLIEGAGLWFHARHMNLEQGEGAASHYVQCTTFGKTYLTRNSLLAANILGLLLLITWSPTGYAALLWLLPMLSVITTALVSRALFYILVIPTTMPGAFFWKNKGFEQHAKDVGLAEMPQAGIVADSH